MRLITLNMWCGKLSDKIIDFARANSPSTDVFCFQEVLDNPRGVKSVGMPDGTEDIIARVKEALPDFNSHVAIPQTNERGLATFIRKELEVQKVEDQYVYGGRETMVNNSWNTIGINTLMTRVVKEGNAYSIWNLHGKFVNLDKKDYPETIAQSNNLKKFIQSEQGKRILCGDLNLAPDTESIGILERIPLRNLVREYGITSTRTEYFKFPEKFADYIMPSSEVVVKDFRVLEDVVSDHYPLLLDCK